MTYKEALEYIHGTLRFGSKLGLRNISVLLELMGNPQKKLRYVHVAGTNGKGSTVSFISSVLIEAGYKVGIFISPYIERFTERIKVNNTEIGEDELAEITSLVKDKIEIMVGMGENHPTEFEIITAIALQYYCEKGCDVVVLEVGLGGRFDATNVIDFPEVAVITAISFDHTDILGDTLGKIAFEKAGIIKPGCETVLYPQTEEAQEVFEKACWERGSNLHRVDLSSLKLLSFGADGQEFDYSSGERNYKALRISLLGDHQARNAALAVKALEVLEGKGFIIPEEALKRGLLKARWPGRLEILSTEPFFMIDGAHNAEGAKVLAEALKKYFPEKRKIFIMGVLKDKDYKTMARLLAPMADKAIAVTPKSERALSGNKLAEIIEGYCKDVTVSDTIEEAVRISLKAASETDMICAFGSLYYIGEIRKLFRL
ncbi:MAG: bifunctional folylpolyglutamate synthase/dihydrofolate synthase [Clostridia bacterium]|nr:bifunctional folylpolyglutamate synthase/dihydrofolate synthase [Clostridia bacterium]